ncbi:uncharacterized protein L969DRAFT_97172 [Mixia osmundae IAM 14324]|uniref:Uncharacterized protein n=1 Tax=Mixia osmundae (strain CBS 9802 / IAM 14324 / JCM 22182 / KY 12970) TaxID=764103 RepID=G7DW60_MIXOS|nr:uncharacterized protein L969DRAFT_97172 [Mixia osmundae IAM 14324]KEI36437.1 hypothetical protein L969DRAFT_97172 [Mixia osmundae IAM 14324]GAA94866.1 hypothetical protein E5Q_01520 [Mixia osmundae IAM 14324]
MFGEEISESPRLDSPFQSLSSVLASTVVDSGQTSGAASVVQRDGSYQKMLRRASSSLLSCSTTSHATASDELDLPLQALHIDRKLSQSFGIAPESDDSGHIEYKYRLQTATGDRLGRLVTQLKWRLIEGGGLAIYEIGILDDGTLIGLDAQDLEISLRTLRTMADQLSAKVDILRKIEISPSSDPETEDALALKIARQEAIDEMGDDPNAKMKRDLIEAGYRREPPQYLRQQTVQGLHPRTIKMLERQARRQKRDRVLLRRANGIFQDTDDEDSDSSSQRLPVTTATVLIPDEQLITIEPGFDWPDVSLSEPEPPIAAEATIKPSNTTRWRRSPSNCFSVADDVYTSDDEEGDLEIVKPLEALTCRPPDRPTPSPRPPSLTAAEKWRRREVRREKSRSAKAALARSLPSEDTQPALPSSSRQSDTDNSQGSGHSSPLPSPSLVSSTTSMSSASEPATLAQSTSNPSEQTSSDHSSRMRYIVEAQIIATGPLTSAFKTNTNSLDASFPAYLNLEDFGPSTN